MISISYMDTGLIQKNHFLAARSIIKIDCYHIAIFGVRKRLKVVQKIEEENYPVNFHPFIHLQENRRVKLPKAACRCSPAFRG